MTLTKQITKLERDTRKFLKEYDKLWERPDVQGLDIDGSYDYLELYAHMKGAFSTLKKLERTSERVRAALKKKKA